MLYFGIATETLDPYLGAITAHQVFQLTARAKSTQCVSVADKSFLSCCHDVTGIASESLSAKGKSWCAAGARNTINEILESLDRDSILQSARGDIMRRFKAPVRPFNYLNNLLMTK